MPTERPRRFEPWPLLLATLLAAMIGISLSFYRVASQNPDPVLTRAAQPGLER